MTIEELENKIRERTIRVRKKSQKAGWQTYTAELLGILENQADLAKMIRNIKEGLS